MGRIVTTARIEPTAIERDGIDLSEVRLADSRMVRWVYVALGTLMVAIGVGGFVVPGLPTTVFLLMAAALYARSSERMYGWLLRNRFVFSLINRPAMEAAVGGDRDECAGEIAKF